MARTHTRIALLRCRYSPLRPPRKGEVKGALMAANVGFLARRIAFRCKGLRSESGNCFAWGRRPPTRKMQRAFSDLPTRRRLKCDVPKKDRPPSGSAKSGRSAREGRRTSRPAPSGLSVSNGLRRSTMQHLLFAQLIFDNIWLRKSTSCLNSGSSPHKASILRQACSTVV